MTRAVVETIANEIGALSERMVKPDVVLVALPIEIIERTYNVGMRFYHSVDGDVHTSTAQMFDERGEGLILRGGRMVESEEDRKPHLTAEDAFDLLRNSLPVLLKYVGEEQEIAPRYSFYM